MADCFIICPIGDPESSTRKHADQLLTYVLKPVLSESDYRPIRADQIPKSGVITTQIINMIIESPLVIADLTDLNPNVFYELAIRHATRKPHIQIAKHGQHIPFDIAGVRTIFVDLSDLDSVDESKNAIADQVAEIKLGHVPDSPISTAVGARVLRNDGELAEKIASRVNSYIGFMDFFDGVESIVSHSDALEERVADIHNKLWSFPPYGNLSLEDIHGKLEEILRTIRQLGLLYGKSQ